MKFNYMKSAAMALAFACCVSSCSDFLEEENKTGATAELEYATVSGIDGLMGSAYSFLRLWAGKPAAYCSQSWVLRAAFFQTAPGYF